MEGLGLGLFMLSAALFSLLVFHPASLIAGVVPDPVLRRIAMGVAMGLTAVCLIYSPWGRRSGAHLNPAVTLTFLRLRKIAGWDALFYICAQFAGGATGVAVATLLSSGRFGHPAVKYAVTIPGWLGWEGAFAGEFAISLGLMALVLTLSNNPRLAPWTGLCAGALVATYIAIEAPVSGMSMNPARTFASALSAHLWTAYWVYVAAPLGGMLLAAELHVRLRRRPVRCAKLHHDRTARCIFRCGWAAESSAS